jgi:hypothetical protein
VVERWGNILAGVWVGNMSKVMKIAKIVKKMVNILIIRLIKIMIVNLNLIMLKQCEWVWAIGLGHFELLFCGGGWLKKGICDLNLNQKVR